MLYAAGNCAKSNHAVRLKLLAVLEKAKAEAHKIRVILERRKSS